MAPNVAKSPFLHPSTPRKTVQVNTPGGSSRLVKKSSPAAKEHKSTVAGATSNLVNALIGAGIVGIPFAFKHTGLVAGVFLVLLCAVLTEKSLRLLIETAKYVAVPSYEMLFESTYGSFGFYFISINMLIMAYGGCLSYLTIIKDTLPVLLGVQKGNLGMERAILVVSTMAIILPISMQRDMADLAKTSKISVLFQCAMVVVVVIFSPVSSSIESHGGLQQIAANSIIKSSTVFIGLGVLSFAFVCQHAAFIVAGSLDNPTKKRWGNATRNALFLCVILEVACGVAGYLAFLEDTEGNILNNFFDLGGDAMELKGNIARALMCITMFLVYPMDSYVCRHVLVELFFDGRSAHEGDDASVLRRRDRRVAITLVVYFSCLFPALVVDDVGEVLALTGTIGASSLAYIGPGLVYMAVYGGEFLEKVDTIWGSSDDEDDNQARDVESSRLIESTKTPRPTSGSTPSQSVLQTLVGGTAWYLLFMPIWVSIATLGKNNLSKFRENEALRSPQANRLGKLEPNTKIKMQIPRGTSLTRLNDNSSPLPQSQAGPKMLPYGAVLGGNKAIGAAILKRQSDNSLANRNDEEEVEKEDINIPPTWYDFFLAIFLIVFGIVALCAGLVSIIVTS